MVLVLSKSSADVASQALLGTRAPKKAQKSNILLIQLTTGGKKSF